MTLGSSLLIIPTYSRSRDYASSSFHECPISLHGNATSSLTKEPSASVKLTLQVNPRPPSSRADHSVLARRNFTAQPKCLLILLSSRASLRFMPSANALVHSVRNARGAAKPGSRSTLRRSDPEHSAEPRYQQSSEPSWGSLGVGYAAAMFAAVDLSEAEFAGPRSRNSDAKETAHSTDPDACSSLLILDQGASADTADEPDSSPAAHSPCMHLRRRMWSVCLRWSGIGRSTA